jgi:presenilin-like A22 family membrane protease
MKHNLKITIILIMMFLLTQLIGIFVISVYNLPENEIPFGMEPPEEVKQNSPGHLILIAFVIAIILFFLLTKINAEMLIRAWFFLITVIALGLTLNAVFVKINIPSAVAISLIIAIPLAYMKIFRRDLLIHNITELLIYPGIAAVFVPILNITWLIIILLLISFYDMWAVWHTEFMQKMAKYQMTSVKVFAGFFIPYADKKTKLKIRKIKEKYQGESQKFLESKLRKEKIKIHLAILGGGDVIFPIIAAGIFYRFFGLLPALVISIFSTIALLLLFYIARKGKFYPAMPFITIGIYLGMLINWIFLRNGFF